MSSKVRTRFAPSPTGFMHVGGVRTALFAWLVARQTDGKFILRIEDTDKTREVKGSEQHIVESLKWLGLEWDEGPDKGGQFGPYRQSERLDIYKEWAQKLLDRGLAYTDDNSPQSLEKLRQAAIKEKRAFLFRERRPNPPAGGPPKWDGHHPLRLKSQPKTYKWHDEVMGDLSSGPEAIDDFIIIKSDGFPTYNFAHIIDDQLMQISHVIRSQEFLSSVPKYLNLYEALGFERPLLATLPYVLGTDGKKKLSKRDGARDILDYAKTGYLPSGLVNFLATLGWNDGTEQEIFSIDELIEKFSLAKVQRSGAKFDEKRLEWINGHHIRALSLAKLYEAATGFWPKSAKTAGDSYKKAVLELVQQRLKYLAELPALTNFFFEDLPVDPKLITADKQLSQLSKKEISELLAKSLHSLAKSDFSLPDLTNRLNGLLEETKQKPAVLFSLIRIATTWAPASPQLADTLAVLGKELSMRRLQTSVDSLS